MSGKSIPLALALAALAAGQARAATPAFTSAVTVGHASASPPTFFGFTPFGATLAADGSATIAWSAPDHGIQVAERLPGGGPFGAPSTISDDVTGNVGLAANDAGARAAAWTTTVAPNMTRLKVAVAPPGAPFRAEEEVPVPPRGPGSDPNRVDERYIDGGHLAVAPDGTLLV